MINAQEAGAIGDNATDNRAVLQAIFDNNPHADLWFPYGTYVSSGPIYLSDITGRNYRGNINSSHATLRFINAGSPTDTDALMQNGLVAYTRQNSLGGDIQGVQDITINGLKFIGPANGCGLRLCNSQRVKVERCTFTGNRYGHVQEYCNLMVVQENYFTGSFNAGLGFLATVNSNVWYGAADLSAYANDGPIIKGNLFIGSVAGSLAHILDHGSKAECVRTFEGNAFYNSPNTTAFGYLARQVNPTFLGGDWFEAVNYPVRILSSNAAEAYYFPGNFPGVTAAQPGGTYDATKLPEGLSFSGSFKGMFFSKAIDDLNLSGLSYGPSHTGAHFSTLNSHRHIIVKPIGSLFLTDTGSTYATNGGGIYMDPANGNYINLSKITVGAPDSGGAGFRLLRLPN